MKTPGSLLQYYRDEPTLNGINNITDLPADSHNSISLKFKEKKKNRASRKRWHKRRGNNGTIKISK